MSLPEKATAREALVHAAGDAHESHSVMTWWYEGSFIVMRCSCESAFKVAYSKEIKTALRNAKEVLTS